MLSAVGFGRNIATSDLLHVGFRGHGEFRLSLGGSLVVIRHCEWELGSARASCTERVHSLGCSKSGRAREIAQICARLWGQDPQSLEGLKMQVSGYRG